MTGSEKWSECRRIAQPTGGRGRPRRFASLHITGRLILLIGTSACGDGGGAPAPIPLEDRTPRVLLIGIDGVRPDVMQEVATPNIDALAVGGSFTIRTRTTTPSVSGPAWSSMLTGVWPEKHGVTNNDFTGRRYDDFPDFLTLIERVRPELSTFAAVDWLPLMEIEGGGPALSEVIDVRVPLDGYVLGWAEADADVTAQAVRHLAQADPDAMFVYLGHPDEASHQSAAIGEEYREAIASADRHVGMLVDAIRSREQYGGENWLVIISTDHGRRADGDHGGASPEEMTTFILVAGPGAALGPPAGDTFIVDVAATALTHLGIPLDPGWQIDGRAVGLR